MTEWIVFMALALIAVATAAGMLITMSMARAGLALMSSFVALAGLFVLLDADLLAAIQIMMNVGGMLVMIVFMVMMTMDPGGEMMWDMKRRMHLPGPGALSMRMPGDEPPAPGRAMARHHHAEETDASDRNGGRGAASEHRHGKERAQHHRMMVDMAMSTAQLPWAIAVGAATALILGVLAVRTPWPVAGAVPTQDAATAIGELLLSRYMIAFEGAALLIFAGIAGAVIFGKRERQPVAQNGDQPPRPAHAPTIATMEAGPAAQAADHRGDVYTCPMHPEVRSPVPGKCPKCGMTLIRAPESKPQGSHG
jgi:NADH-quinone oxidoreductase subunit J